MVACARFTGRTEKECTRRGWGCPCNEEKEAAFHALRVEDIPVLLMPSQAWYERQLMETVKSFGYKGFLSLVVMLWKINLKNRKTKASSKIEIVLPVKWLA